MIFQNNKPFFLLILSSVILAINFKCSSHKPSLKFKLNLNKGIIDSLINKYGENIAILSCLRCDCFRDEFNKRFLKNNESPTGYMLMTDTICTKLKFQTVFLSSFIIDKISEDIFNLVLIKSRKGLIFYKILPIEESQNIQGAADRFFN